MVGKEGGGGGDGGGDCVCRVISDVIGERKRGMSMMVVALLVAPLVG